MAGSSRDAGSAARLVAANLRRVRQERGLSYAELARKLAAIGHPVADTALLKTEKGDRRASVDDLAALAVALEVTPNRLLLPAVGDAPEGDDLPPWGKEAPLSLWAWATGEVPLGRAPASAATERRDRGAEVTFSRQNRQHLWNPPVPAPPPTSGAAVARTFSRTGLAAFVQDAFAAGLTTGDIRATVEGALARALVNPDPTAPPRIEVGDGRVTVWTSPPDPDDEQEAP
jgi:transcriptional regulator with XRE-family HTH domain